MRKKPKPRSSSTKQLSPRSAGVADIEMERRIRLRRRETGISQTELADHLGLSFQQMQKYEKASAGSARRSSSKSLRCSASTYRFSTMVAARNQTATACSSSTAFSASDYGAPTPPSKTKRCAENL